MNVHFITISLNNNIIYWIFLSLIISTMSAILLSIYYMKIFAFWIPSLNELEYIIFKMISLSLILYFVIDCLLSSPTVFRLILKTMLMICWNLLMIHSFLSLTILYYWIWVLSFHSYWILALRNHQDLWPIFYNNLSFLSRRRRPQPNISGFPFFPECPE